MHGKTPHEPTLRSYTNQENRLACSGAWSVGKGPVRWTLNLYLAKKEAS